MAMVEAPSTTSLAGPSHALETAVGPDTSDLGDPLRELLVKVHLLFHGAFRAEMEQITADAMKLDECELDALEQDADAGACGISRLLHRYAFLYSCYKFHSTAEDEVVFPALERRVHNVVRAYSLEHEAEEELFRQVERLLFEALDASGEGKRATIRALCRTCEAAQIALCQHLDKEEEQVLPLLRSHFSVKEQAEMLWQLLCSMPVGRVGPVMQWALSAMEPEEVQAIVSLLHTEVSDLELQSLVHIWLVPQPKAQREQERQDLVDSAKSYLEKKAGAGDGPAEARALDAAQDVISPPAGPADGSDSLARVGVEGGSRPPIRDILLVHDTIRAEMQEFKAAVQQVLAAGATRGAGAKQLELEALHKQEQFLSAMCGSHTQSEEEVLFPAVDHRTGKVVPGRGGYRTEKLSREHEEESRHLATLREAVHEALLECHVYAREEATREQRLAHQNLMRQLSDASDAALLDIANHLLAEEAELLPMVERHFSTREQRCLFWKVLLGMPLKVLEHLLGRIGGLVDADQAEALLRNLQLAAPENSEGMCASMCSVLPKVFARWLRRHKKEECADANAQPTCDDDDAAPSGHTSASAASADAGECLERGTKRKATALLDTQALDTHDTQTHTACTCDSSGSQEPCAAQMRSSLEAHHHHIQASDLHSYPHPPRSQTPADDANSEETAPEVDHESELRPREQPIDHIFQFHRALRRELEKLERQSQELLDLHNGGSHQAFAPGLEALHTRLQFLWGIYKTHSKAEDEIVFPALESKDALHNVSHSYSLDHCQEEVLFREIADVVKELRGTLAAVDLTERGRLLTHVAGMCTAIRVCLMKHLACEDQELWPLFTTYFTVQEQEQVIGAIVGRSSAEVLQVMLPLIQAETNPREEEEMIHSISEVTKNTNFGSWFKSWWRSEEQAAGTSGREAPTAAAAPPPGSVQANDMDGRLAEVAPYLQEEPTDSSSNKDKSDGELVVSWHNVYQLNQAQLVSAVRRVSCDSTLEPKRKAYLMQNLLTVRWLIAQQQASDTNTSPRSPGVQRNATSCSRSGASLKTQRFSVNRKVKRCPKDQLPPPPPPPGGPALPMFRFHDKKKLLSFHNAEASPPVLGCEHYARNCQLVAGAAIKQCPAACATMRDSHRTPWTAPAPPTWCVCDVEPSNLLGATASTATQ
eukprot:CAMPEP_0114229952 /NCGR_PEP_ID=MMETSP0058-20121206/3200_1 /TAXON_ID=36894 /ORGANISM="Pyramimonas parkeae, CCMP726" /LENGTH=1165 /DNA_ID=CAMNT_0001341099 /DNA_START=82 /DNA_END=3581 /DNA_ORIENTATION=+